MQQEIYCGKFINIYMHYLHVDLPVLLSLVFQSCLPMTFQVLEPYPISTDNPSLETLLSQSDLTQIRHHLMVGNYNILV